MTRRDIKAGGAFVELSMRGPFQRQLRMLERKFSSIGRMGSKFEGLGSSLSSLGAKLTGLTGLLGAPLALGVKNASDMEETMSKFNIVFGAAAPEMKQFGENLAQTLGRSKKQIASFLASSQDLFIPLGFEPGAATELSKQLTSLAVDLGSFNNMADADVLRDLQAALTGSGEVMKKYGVLVSEAAVKQELLNTGINPKEATDQQKVMARMAIILRGTTAAQGDAQRTSGSFANQMKRMRGVLTDLSVTLGQALLPTLTKFVSHINRQLTPLGRWLANNQELVRQIALIGIKVAAAATAIVGLGTVIGTVGTTLGGLATAFGVVIGILGAPFLGPIALAGAAVTALAANIPGVQKAFKDGFAGLQGVVEHTMTAVSSALAGGNLTLAVQQASIGLQVLWRNLILSLQIMWLEFKKFVVLTIHEMAADAFNFMEENRALFGVTGFAVPSGFGDAFSGAGQVVGSQVDREIATLQDEMQDNKRVLEARLKENQEQARKTAENTAELVRMMTIGQAGLPVIP